MQKVSLLVSAQICSMLSRHVALLILEDAEDAGEPRDAGVLPSRFWRQVAGAPGLMTIISLHGQSAKAILAPGFGGGFFFF